MRMLAESQNYWDIEILGDVFQTQYEISSYLIFRAKVLTAGRQLGREWEKSDKQTWHSSLESAAR